MTTRKCRAKLPAACRVHGLPARNLKLYQQVNERVGKDEQAFEDFICNSPEPVVADIRHYLLAGTGTPSISYCNKHQGYHPYRIDDALAFLQPKKAAFFKEEFLHDSNLAIEEQRMGRQLASAKYDIIKERILQEKNAISSLRRDADEGTSNLRTISASKVPDDLMLEYWQCARKRPYSSAVEAQSHVDVATDGERMNVYNCSYCGKFHVGHGKGDNTIEEQIQKARAHWGTNKQADIFAFRKGLV